MPFYIYVVFKFVIALIFNYENVHFITLFFWYFIKYNDDNNNNNNFICAALFNIQLQNASVVG